MAVEIAAEHGIALTNPELQEKLVEGHAKRIEERQQKEAARRKSAWALSKDRQSNCRHRRTDVEIAVGLEAVRERTQTEARREVKQAERSAATNERPFDGGGEDHAYRTSSEATAAVSAERSVEQNPSSGFRRISTSPPRSNASARHSNSSWLKRSQPADRAQQAEAAAVIAGLARLARFR